MQGDVCEYCGTHYKKRQFLCNIEDCQGILTIGGNTYNVYVGDVEAYLVGVDSYRNADGILMRESPKTKHKFTLIEI